MPSYIGGIIGRTSPSTLIKHRPENYGDCMPARIATRVSERAYLLEMNAAESGLFEEFSGRGSFERFVLVDEATRESPQSFERFASALDQQHLDAISGRMKQQDVDGERRTGMIVAMGL